eukprot:TRINITY_DN24034_c0_g1_i1.p1 TRINITY_DN24034_c0_g1~~TRINITY_DN24034_c0_g1_i1.p1  ORF type:complete len:141 (-),score=29.93 TRINITY_DN24034_c0_g1_i1:42-464(-)
MKLYFCVAFLALSLAPTHASSLKARGSSTSSPDAPPPGRFSLLARYLYPEKCNECARDVENVIDFCFPSILSLVDPECVGALAYASRSCRQCLCEVVAAQLSPELSVKLCPYCPELEVCPNTTVPSEYIQYFEGKIQNHK